MQVDLLVTETFDGGLLGEHVLESLAHAWQTFLTPGHSRYYQHLLLVLQPSCAG